MRLRTPFHTYVLAASACIFELLFTFMDAQVAISKLGSQCFMLTIIKTTVGHRSRSAAKLCNIDPL